MWNASGRPIQFPAAVTTTDSLAIIQTHYLAQATPGLRVYINAAKCNSSHTSRGGCQSRWQERADLCPITPQNASSRPRLQWLACRTPQANAVSYGRKQPYP